LLLNHSCPNKQLDGLDQLDIAFFAIIWLQTENVFSFRSNLWHVIN